MKRVLEKVFLQSQSFLKKYQTYYDTKRKKLKCIKLSANSLESHSQALYSILLKPVIKSSPSWCRLHDDMKALADCLSHYKDFLNKKAKEISNNHNLLHPVRTVGEFTSVSTEEAVDLVTLTKDTLYWMLHLEKDQETFMFFR